MRFIVSPQPLTRAQVELDTLTNHKDYDLVDVFTALSAGAQASLLHHINAQARVVCADLATRGQPIPVKVYCDIDDTLYAKYLDGSFPVRERPSIA